MTRRTSRVASELQALIARLLREEVADPRIGMVTLTRVDVAPDLSHAIVFWSSLGPHGEEATQACQDGLESAAGFLRRRDAAHDHREPLQAECPVRDRALKRRLPAVGRGQRAVGEQGGELRRAGLPRSGRRPGGCRNHD